MVRVDQNVMNMKKKILQLEKRVARLEQSITEIKTMLDPEKKHIFDAELDRVEAEVEAEVEAHLKEQKKAAEEWRKDEERFLHLDEKKKDENEGNVEGGEG